MELLLQLEIIIWLVLTLMLVVTPLVRLTNRYMPKIKKLFTHIKDIELPNTNTLREAGQKIQQAASLAPGRNDTPDKKEPIQEHSESKGEIPVTKEDITPTEEEKTILKETDIRKEDENKKTPVEIIIEKETYTEETEKEDIVINATIGSTQTIGKDESDLEPESAYTPDISLDDAASIELPDEQIKKNKKLETIKFAALASKERGKLNQYERKLVEGLALDPGNITFLNLLSTHYFDSNQEIKALTLLKKVVNKEPKNHKAIRQIGQIYTSQKQFETAQLLIEKAIALKDDHPKYYISLVEIRYETGNIQKAIQTMEKLLKLRPTNTDYLLTMATLFEEDKKPTLASKYYSKVLEIDPSNTHGKKGMKRVK